MVAPGLHDDNTVDAVIELTTSHATDIKMPNFARWMTIFPALALFLDSWTVIYFIVVAIKRARCSG